MNKMFFYSPVQIVAAYFLDWMLGDRENFFHPVRWMGKAIQAAEPFLRRTFQNLYAAGTVLAIGLVGTAGVLAWVSILLVDAIAPWAGVVWRIYLFYVCLSTRSLVVEVRRVLRPLGERQIEQARFWLSRIVGRDTTSLNEKEILRAAVETTAESTVDGIISVLFYSFLGGPVLALMFKMISTLDSMVGYKNDRYKQFGWASAKLDDMANYLPARLAALVIALASFFIGGAPRQALHVVWKEAASQPSPNSGYPEAAFAGALRVQLGGENIYNGQAVRKATMGQPLEELTIQKAEESLRLMIVSSALTLLLVTGMWLFCRSLSIAIPMLSD